MYHPFTNHGCLRDYLHYKNKVSRWESVLKFNTLITICRKGIPGKYILVLIIQMISKQLNTTLVSEAKMRCCSLLIFPFQIVNLHISKRLITQGQSCKIKLIKRSVGKRVIYLLVLFILYFGEGGEEQKKEKEESLHLTHFLFFFNNLLSVCFLDILAHFWRYSTHNCTPMQLQVCTSIVHHDEKVFSVPGTLPIHRVII